MLYLLLVSGAALIAAAAVLAAQARLQDVGLPLSRTALALVAAFAAAHGASDWAEMASVARGAGANGADTIATLQVVLLAGSFALLFGFALAVPGPRHGRQALVRAIAIAALATWGLSLLALFGSGHDAFRTVPRATVEVVSRWVLGVPASVCAALALLPLARSFELESWVGARLVRWAGVAFLIQGAADAAGTLPGILHLVSPSAAPALGAGVRVAFGLVDTGSAAAIAVLLSEAFVFQASQRLRREETHLRDDFIALVAHELGNPLAALELASERLDICRRGAREVDPRLSGDVKACATTLRRIVMDLLDTSRIHAQELVTTPCALDLRPLLARAAEVASLHEPGRPPVSVSCPDDLPHVLADPARVDQVLGNLLTNASKYSAPCSPVAIAAEAGDGKVTVRVVNEGPCIEAAEASRIFSRHYRAHAATRGTTSGLGLGLYVARALVEAQCGRIWVESRDRRTAFCFTLPSAAVVPPAVAPGEDEALEADRRAAR